MSFWKGTLSFGLVEIPVSLRPALDADELKFTLLDRKDFSPVGNKRYNKTTGKEVQWDQVVRGYEYEPDEYVVLSDDELRRANAKATQTIDIFEFVEQGAIEPVYFDTPYFIEPLKQGSKSYSLLREALAGTARIGVARVVLRTRQRLAAVVVRGKVMMLDLLRYAHELREPEDLDVPAKGDKKAGVSERELDMAKRLIQGMTGKWQPASYRDEYRDDVMALVKRKVKAGQSRTIVEPEPDEDRPARKSEVVDLMPLLKRSLEARGARGAAASRSKPAERATRVRPATARASAKAAPKRRRRSA